MDGTRHDAKHVERGGQKEGLLNILHGGDDKEHFAGLDVAECDAIHHEDGLCCTSLVRLRSARKDSQSEMPLMPFRRTPLTDLNL